MNMPAYDFYAIQCQLEIDKAKTEARNEAIEMCAKLCDGKRLNASNWKEDAKTWEGDLSDVGSVYAFGGEQMASDCARSLRKLKK